MQFFEQQKNNTATKAASNYSHKHGTFITALKQESQNFYRKECPYEGLS